MLDTTLCTDELTWVRRGLVWHDALCRATPEKVDIPAVLPRNIPSIRCWSIFAWCNYVWVNQPWSVYIHTCMYVCTYTYIYTCSSCVRHTRSPGKWAVRKSSTPSNSWVIRLSSLSLSVLQKTVSKTSYIASGCYKLTVCMTCACSEVRLVSCDGMRTSLYA